MFCNGWLFGHECLPVCGKSRRSVGDRYLARPVDNLDRDANLSLLSIREVAEEGVPTPVNGGKS
jgi:hypothetical protein